MSRFDPDEVVRRAERYGWYEYDYQWSQGHLVILERHDADGERCRLNVWCTTGTVGSYLNHPRRGKTQLFRRSVYSMDELCDVFENPRVHGYDGYYTRNDGYGCSAYNTPPPQTTKPPRTVPCPACGRLYRTMADTAQHFESGWCPHCPGAENAGRAAYAYARQMEEAAGASFTTGQRLLTFNGSGERDWGCGYEADGTNYRCPSCRKGFRALHSMLSHIQSRPQCQAGGDTRALTFH